MKDSKNRILIALTALLGLALCTNHGLNCFAKSTVKTAVETKSSAKKENQAAKYRLAESVHPIEYELRFEPDLAKFTFTGEESIKIKIDKACKGIVLNALELKISSAQLLSENSNNARQLETVFDKETQKVTFVANAEIAPGQYVLNCKFEGVLNNQLRGFYRAQYEDENHKKRFVAATQMEPTDARRVFPCFDEPALKSTFRISAAIPENLVAISNTPVEQESAINNGKKLVRFEATPVMPTYLLSLVVGDFKSTGQAMCGKIPVRVWAVAGKEQLGKYALSEAPRILEFLTDYFAVPYIGKKMDLVALPEFSAGAMENIGAVTFHESSLLTDDKLGSSFQRQGIFGTIAHEFAHQWFGDLVTMQWWDDLWLNEAFATWMATKVEEALHPEWHSLTETVFEKNYALSTDALKATRAIHANVLNAAQAIEMFDGITYTKGASILRMLEAYVGDKDFQKGITAYLKMHQFNNARAEDLWSAIAQQKGDLPVAQIMKRYVFQPGYPQLTVKMLGAGEVELTQYRQFTLGQDKQDPALWWVPIVMSQLESGVNQYHLFNKRTEKTPLKINGDKPLLVNVGGNGYYRVCYEPAHLKRLQDSFQKLKAEEKILLITDCSSLVLPGDLPVESYYNFVNEIKNESDPLILNQLTGFVGAPWQFIQDDAQKRVVYGKWVRHVLLPLKDKLDGWNQKESDSQQTKELRSSCLDLLGTMGQDKRTIDEAFARFNKYASDRNSINPDLVSTVMRIVAFNGGTKEYEQVLKLWKTAKNPHDEETALSVLSDFHQADLAKRTLALGMSKGIKGEEGLGLIAGVALNRYTRDIGWPYVKQHWNEIMKKFPEETLSMLVGAGGNCDTPEKEKECKDWYSTHPIPYAKSSTARMLERLHIRVLYRQRYGARVTKWMLAEAAKIPKAN